MCSCISSKRRSEEFFSVVTDIPNIHTSESIFPASMNIILRKPLRASATVSLISARFTRANERMIYPIKSGRRSITAMLGLQRKINATQSSPKDMYFLFCFTLFMCSPLFSFVLFLLRLFTHIVSLLLCITLLLFVKALSHGVYKRKS